MGPQRCVKLARDLDAGVWLRVYATFQKDQHYLQMSPGSERGMADSCQERCLFFSPIN